MTKRPAPTGAWQERLRAGGPDEGYRVMASRLALYNIDRNKTGDTEEAGWMTGAPWMTGSRDG